MEKFTGFINNKAYSFDLEQALVLLTSSIDDIADEYNLGGAVWDLLDDLAEYAKYGARLQHDSLQDAEWDEFDENYPNNPYKYGYEVNDRKYATGYTGAAGKFWRDQDRTYWLAC